MSGSRRVSFSIGGWGVELEARSSGLDGVLTLLETDWGAFRTADPPKGLRLIVQATGDAPPRPTDWRPLLPKGQRDITGTLTAEGDGVRVMIQPSGELGVVQGFRERYPIDAAVRLLLADALAARGGLLLHGVAIAHRGKAAVFTGFSGAGKSTLAAWASQGGLTVLADELVAVAPSESGFTVHGTPWNSGAAASATLAMLGVLAHGPAARLRAVEASAVLRVLLSNVLEPVDTANMRSKLFQISGNMLNAVPARELEFARAPDVAQVLREALA